MYTTDFDLSQILRLPLRLRVRRMRRKYWEDTAIEPERLTRREVESVFRDQLAGLRRGDRVRGPRR
jgi:hypothetical protein